MPLEYTPIKSIANTVERVRSTFNTGSTRSYEWRKAQIENCIRFVTENRDQLEGALHKDLGQNSFFCQGVELETIIVEAKHCLANLKSWMKPEKVGTPLLQLPGSSVIMREPYGVVLNIAPFNYPMSLALVPMVQAFAAGNVVVLKPSEISHNSAEALGELLPKYFDDSVLGLVQGAIPETTELLAQKYDLIMYTGNNTVAKIIMAAAAKNLTPVILELGGKCPAIVDSSAALDKIVPRIVWGKFTCNMGQTCVSPDYILTTPEMEGKLVSKIKETMTKFYTDSPKTCKDIGRIVNERHASRVSSLLDDDKIEVLVGGDHDVSSCYVSPTVVKASPQAKCMQDEIFGPILPIVTVKNVDEAISFVNSRDKPLALYIFTQNGDVRDRVLASTSSGGACVNDCVMHVGNPDLPFGGVGPSGMGAYHGKWGFEAFSHRKSVYFKGPMADPSLRFPPYTDSKLKQLTFLRGVEFATVGKVLGGLAVAGGAAALSAGLV